MLHFFFLLPFLCKIYRNSSILLFQGNVSSRLCFSLFAWLYYYSVVVYKKSPECLLWMCLYYRRLDVSITVVTVNYECPALIRTVTGGSVCIQLFGSKVLTHTGWGFSLTVCGCFSIGSPKSLTKKSWDVSQRYSNAHILMRWLLISIHFLYSPLFPHDLSLPLADLHWILCNSTTKMAPHLDG